MKKGLTYIIITIALCNILPNTFAQVQERSFDVIFRLDKYDIDSTYMGNDVRLATLHKFLKSFELDSNLIINEIEVNASTSPEAGVAYNKRLSERRANALRNYLIENTNIPHNLLKAKGNGIAWGQLEELVKECNLDKRNKVLDIIKNVPEETWVNGRLVDSRLKHLENLDKDTYNYIDKEFFTIMRNSNAILVRYENLNLIPSSKLQSRMVETSVSTTDIPQEAQNLNAIDLYNIKPAKIKTPIAAIKTNLLYDVASVLNIELEIPLGKRFSITGEYTFPWWYSVGSKYTMRTQMGVFGVNYWLGNRDKYEKLNGWYVGLNAGYAKKYDVQLFDISGIQGDYLMAGATLGYTHTLYKSLRIQYQMGAGWMQSNYRNYTMAYGTEYGDIKVFDYPWEEKRFTWIGPTQLRISLMWVINYKKRSKAQ